MQHISEIHPKTAANILAATLLDDPYHNVIMVAAGEMVAAGMGYFTYHTQYAGGTTAWTHTGPFGNFRYLQVDSNGHIR